MQVFRVEKLLTLIQDNYFLFVSYSVWIQHMWSSTEPPEK